MTVEDKEKAIKIIDEMMDEYKFDITKSKDLMLLDIEVDEYTELCSYLHDKVVNINTAMIFIQRSMKKSVRGGRE